MKQAIKKGSTIKGGRKTISDFKSKMGLNIATSENQEGLKASNADKPIEWLIMPKAFQETLKLSIPCGYVTTVVGHSNTGKSTIVNHAVVAAQRQGYVPVIIDTENNFDFRYAMDMGMEATPINEVVEIEKVNPETGEIDIVQEERTVAYDGNFIYLNNTILAERFGDIDYTTGKPVTKKRTVAVIEDVARAINTILDEADQNIDEPICNGFVFVFDSVGSINGWKSYNSSANNAMWDAASMSVAFNTILNDRIPRSRKVSSPYTHTLLIINKIWIDSMGGGPMSQPSLALKNGSTVFYASRLILLCGGQLKASIKKLTAESKGMKYTWGIETKLSVLKNQLPAPYTVAYAGSVICTATGMIPADKESVDNYKKTHLADILKTLRELSNGNPDVQITESDISFDEEEAVE